MAKKLLTLAIVSIFIFSAAGVYAAEGGKSLDQPTAQSKESVKDRLSRGVNNIFYGHVEVPGNLDETRTKGTPVAKCTTKTRSGVERGIARTFAGIWQIATFWTADPGCVTKAPTSSSSAAIAEK